MKKAGRAGRTLGLPPDRKDDGVDPDTNVAELTIDEAAHAALRHAIDSMYAEGRQPDLFDEYRMRQLCFATTEDGEDDVDQSSSDGVAEA